MTTGHRIANSPAAGVAGATTIPIGTTTHTWRRH